MVNIDLNSMVETNFLYLLQGSQSRPFWAAPAKKGRLPLGNTGIIFVVHALFAVAQGGLLGVQREGGQDHAGDQVREDCRWALRTKVSLVDEK